ncbi:MAG: OB-fold nucleic acid binding domain-containing protein, partial [Rhodothermales bacterium]
MRELSEQELRRREELQELREAGIDPYPYGWEVEDQAALVLDTFDDQVHQPNESGVAREQYSVSLAGRIMSKRVMGKAAFFDLQDESGSIQIYI